LISESPSHSRLALASGCGLCFLAVAIGAFAAHALADVLVANKRVDTFELANRYHFFHGLALIALSFWRSNQPATSVRFAEWALLAGTCIFSGSLYALSFSNIGALGAITPLGGLLLLTGWAWLIFLSLKE